MKRICVVAGEASGDLHGAHLVRALKARGGVSVSGTGGPAMRAVVDGPFLEMAGTNVTGFSAVLKRLPFFLRLLGDVERHVLASRPDLVVTIDNPGLNLRLARRIAAAGVPMAYYVCPQIWAWNPKRIEVMKRCYKKALVVFDFEREIYEKNSMPVAWVGHPLLDALMEGPAAGAREAHNVLLMPGSRVNEVKEMLPAMLEAAAELRARVPGLAFTLIKADTLDDRFYAPYLAAAGVPVHEIRGGRYRAMARATLGLVCSGTATLEAALLGLPMVVAYRGSFLTWVLASAFVKLKYLSLPNLLAGKEIVPELLQYKCTGTNLAVAAAALLNDPAKMRKMEEDLDQISRKVGGPGASDRAAQEILALL